MASTRRERLDGNTPLKFTHRRLVQDLAEVALKPDTVRCGARLKAMKGTVEKVAAAAIIVGFAQRERLDNERPTISGDLQVGWPTRSRNERLEPEAPAKARRRAR